MIVRWLLKLMGKPQLATQGDLSGKVPYDVLRYLNRIYDGDQAKIQTFLNSPQPNLEGGSAVPIEMIKTDRVEELLHDLRYIVGEEKSLFKRRQTKR